MASIRSETGRTKPDLSAGLLQADSLGSSSGDINVDPKVLDGERQGGDLDSKKRSRIVFAGSESQLDAAKAFQEPKNGALDSLPLEIILEILIYLHPLDLLQLARTSKTLRRVLMSRTSCHIWRRARSGSDVDVPECPPDQSEPQWARLLFDLSCSVCDFVGPTKVEWCFRVRGCTGCLKDSLVLGSIVSRESPGVDDIETILDLLPFKYGRAHSWDMYRFHSTIPATLDRNFYRPAVQPMIDTYQSYRKRENPDAEQVLLDFVARCKQSAMAIFEGEKELEAWEDRQHRLRSQAIYKEEKKWRDLYRDKLVDIGYCMSDARMATRVHPVGMKLEDGWETHHTFFEAAALQAKRNRVFQERLLIFHDLCRLFLSQTEKKPPIRGLWPTSSNMLETTPELGDILETAEETSYQDELNDLFPDALDEWWGLRKEILADKILLRGGQTSDVEEDVEEEDISIPPFASAYIDNEGNCSVEVLDLAKSVFSCSCQLNDWLEDCPIYWEESLVNHRCVRERTNGYGYVFNFYDLRFDEIASEQVNAICTALDLDPDETTFAELDELDARFRCVDCPRSEAIMNWRVAMKHQHNIFEVRKYSPSRFEKLPDEEAAIVRQFELENPDDDCPLRRIRSRLCRRTFSTPDELLKHLKKKHGQTELSSENYWVDPCIPPRPVSESDVFEEED